MRFVCILLQCFHSFGILTLVPLLIKTAKNVAIHTLCGAFERSGLGLLLGAGGVGRASIAAVSVVSVAISTVASRVVNAGCLTWLSDRLQ